MPQVPVYINQGGSVQTLDSSGTLRVASGGSIQVESGGVINVASGGSIVNAGGIALASNVTLTNPAINLITLGGTTAKWAFGTTALTSGVGTVGLPGFTRVLAVNANPILGEAPGLGSFTTVMVDLSLSGAGSIIFHAGAGTLPYSNNGTVSWMAYGT